MRETESMTAAAIPDQGMQARQFWLRALLVAGILWGFMPFVLTPFITKGAHDTWFDIFASVLNSLTLLPACTLAFWHRRVACFWLSANAIVLAVALATYIQRTGRFESAMILEVAGPILFALCLDFIEARRWPAALRRRRTA